jgi:RimJ/RimL family protein N-acetyltransferase
LAPAYRGKGLISKIYDRMVELHSLKTLYATIDKSNTASIKAHEKIGFKLLPEEDLVKLRGKGLIKEYEVRLVKNIN